jgi:light-regulated signal transduction histidine kinase (bacteriophytochrome)
MGDDMTDTTAVEPDTKSEFQNLAYMIVHHLKEPARAIRTAAELLLERDPEDHKSENDAPSTAECLGRIRRGVDRLDDIAGSIAQYADDLGSEDEPLKETNTEMIFRSVRQKLQCLMDQSGATVTSGGLPALICQPTRFSRLIEQLLRNAILYHRGQAPAVHISAEEQNDAWLFSMRDNGMGIDPADVERIFDPFSRLSSKGYKGLGMGLTTARKIVSHHGGRIWVESTVDVGSNVFFTLPK